ncbi:MAG: PAS domain-containing sensor histidine kinase [Candidatus Omnitrophota bacterium]|jgi:nitrogen fixation/metabolism regulation signal transduction histidine kinase|nr:MAG: PAS domain-containing sensor histidine kinase [Candidatus Omnitrophota bacterium]
MEKGSGKKTRYRIFYETRILLLALGSGFCGVSIALILIWTWGFTLKAELTLTMFIVLGWLGFAMAARERVISTMRMISNLLAALREGDYQLRAHGGVRDDVLKEVNREINSLADILQEQRRGALEATALLRKVMDEIEIAVMAFDPDEKLRLINRHGERLLGKSLDELKGRTAKELGMIDCLTGEAPRILEFAFPGRTGRWELRRGTYREHGLPHQLIVLSDLTRALREEERQAWQRLVQVLRHEINNSLAPIHSLADSLCTILLRHPRPDQWEEDIRQGLEVIANRSRSLNRFMSSYSKITKLPKPNLRDVDVDECIRRVVELETRMPITVIPGPSIVIKADSDQLDQLLINLLKNAVEAVTETSGSVHVAWKKVVMPTPCLEITIEDEGPGILNPDNLFVPFFTTKSDGSGLGLMLSRQIAEAHNGALILENRADRQGCRACLRIPC